MRILFFVIVFASVHAARADTVQLINGDLLTGTIVEQTDEAIVLDHPVLGRLTVPRAQIKTPAQPLTETADTTPNAAAPVAPSLQTEPSALPTQSPPPPAGFLPNWNKQIEVGFSGKEGNSQTFDLILRAHADQADEYHRWVFDIALYYATSNNTNTKNELFTQLEKDWLNPGSKWFYFTQGRYDYDQFQAWDHRLSGAGGVGYQLIDNDIWQLRGKAGLGGNQTSGSTNDRFAPELLVAVEGAWQISPNQKLTATNSLFPDLSDLGRFRTLSSANWIIKIDRAKGLSLKLGITNEYESITDGSAKHNDIKYQGTLLFDF